MLKVHKFVFNMFGVSTFLLVDEATKNAAVVDAAMVDDHEREVFAKFIADNGITLTQIINTHMHLDHCFGANYVKTRYRVPLKASAADATLGLHFNEQCRRFGLKGCGDAVEIDSPLSDGDTIQIGESSVSVFAVPGHSPGGIALYYPEGHWVISGDSLFDGSIGRTDLEGGDMATLVNSVRSRLLTLPDDTVVLPGHGDFTTVAREKRSNPFLR